MVDGNSGPPLVQLFTIGLTDRLGVHCSISVDPKRYLEALRRFGANGYHPTELPRGGVQMPLANEADFDWRLIGARRYTDHDGDAAVLARGYSWKRRHLEANEKKGMREIIKYSRGARPTDDPTIVEGDDSTNFRYVTLITFRGAGQKLPEYAIPERPERSDA